MKTNSKSKLSGPYSCEEVYERMDKGLCLFCEELDSPGHYQSKHKGSQILMIEVDEEQPFEDNELVKPTVETDLSLHQVVKPLESVTVSLDCVDLTQKEDHAEVFAEEKLNQPLGQSIEHLVCEETQNTLGSVFVSEFEPPPLRPPDPPDLNFEVESLCAKGSTEPDSLFVEPKPSGDMIAIDTSRDTVSSLEKESNHVVSYASLDSVVFTENSPVWQVPIHKEIHVNAVLEDYFSLPKESQGNSSNNVGFSSSQACSLSNRSVWEPGGLSNLLVVFEQDKDMSYLIKGQCNQADMKLHEKHKWNSTNRVWEPGGLLSTQSHRYWLRKTFEMFIQPVNEKVSLEIHYVLDLEAYIGLEICDCKYKEQMLVLVKQCYRVWECGGFLATNVPWKLLEKWYKRDSVFNTRYRLFYFAGYGIIRFEGLQSYCLEDLTSKRPASLVELNKILWGGSNIGEGTTELNLFLALCTNGLGVVLRGAIVGDALSLVLYLVIQDVLKLLVCLVVYNRSLEAELEICILACHSSRNQKLCGTYPCLEVTDLSWFKRLQKTSCFLLKLSFVVWNMAYKRLSKLSSKMTTCFGGNEIKTEAILKEQKEEWLITKGEVNKLQEETMERLLKANETLDYLGTVKKLITDVRFEFVSSKEALVFSRELRQFIATMVTNGSFLLLLRNVSFSLEAQHEAGKVDKSEYNLIEKVVKSIIFAVTDEYKDIETDLVLLGLSLNEYAYKLPYLVKGYGDKDIIKLRVVGFHDMSLTLFYGSLPRPPDFRTIKKRLERLSMHEKDHKLLFPKNHKPLPLRAGFWTLFKDVEQLSTELQNSSGLNYFTDLVFLWNQALNYGCEVDHISSGIFSVDGVHEFDTCSKLQIGNETQDQRLLFLTEISLLDNTNEADLVVKENWFHNNPTIEGLYHLLRPPELLKLPGYPPFFTKYSELSSLRTRMFSTGE